MATSTLGTLYTKTQDRAILTRKIRGVGSKLTDKQIADFLGRSVGAVRQRRYVLTPKA